VNTIKVKLLIFCLLCLSANAIGQVQFCDILPQIINDSRTAFDNAKKKLVSDKPGEKTYVSPYLYNGQPFGAIIQDKAHGIYFIVELSRFATKAEAEKDLGQIANANRCTNKVTLMKRVDKAGGRILEVFEGTTQSFAPANMIIEILEGSSGGFSVVLHAHPTYNRFYSTVRVDADSSEFSVALRDALIAFKRVNVMGKERLTPLTSKTQKFYETTVSLPNADAYIDASHDAFGSTTLVFHLFPGKALENELLDLLFKEAVSKVEASLGKSYSFQKDQYGEGLTYYTTDKIGYLRDGSVLSVNKDEDLKKVTIVVY
jgi:hypothetical protein